MCASLQGQEVITVNQDPFHGLICVTNIRLMTVATDRGITTRISHVANTPDAS